MHINNDFATKIICTPIYIRNQYHSVIHSTGLKEDCKSYAQTGRHFGNCPV